MALVRRCPVCGVIGHTCGPRTGATGIDPLSAPRREQAMGPLREYNVMVNGSPTTMLLSEQDAARLGGTPVAPADTPIAPPADTPVVEAVDPDIKARRPANKARQVDDKNPT